MECLNCGKEILAKEGQRLSDVKVKKFCNRSCAATYNNKKFIKRPSSRTTCKCGNKKTNKARQCMSCKKKENVNYALGRKIKDMFTKGNARIKYSQIRTWAKRLMSDVYKKEKKCEVCGFDVVVEICHIKPISEFDENSLMKDVNSEENLKYLCPNHHAMLDKGLLKIE